MRGKMLAVECGASRGAGEAGCKIHYSVLRIYERHDSNTSPVYVLAPTQSGSPSRVEVYPEPRSMSLLLWKLNGKPSARKGRSFFYIQ